MSARPLRICFTAYRGNMRSGGQGIYLWFLARELAALGHHVDVLVGPPYPDPMPFAASVDRIENQEFWAKWFVRDWSAFVPRERPMRLLRPLDLYELGASRIGFLPEPFAFSARVLRRFVQRLRAGDRWDVVHDVQSLGYGLLGIQALGVPAVTTVHHPLTVDRRASFARDTSFSDAVGTALFYPIGMQRFVARRLRRVLTSSRASAGEIERGFGVAPERLRVLGNGLDTDLFRPQSGVERDPREILCVGRAADPNKGVHVLVRALPFLPPELRVTLVDSAHPGSSARRLAAELGVGDRLHVTGPVTADELVRLYRRAAVVAVPSLYEGFGLPAVEAMACGTPVVASRAGALPEVVEAGGGGVLVPPRDPEALAKSLRTLIEQPDQREALGRHARQRVVERYAWPRVAAATAEVYREVVAERTRG